MATTQVATAEQVAPLNEVDVAPLRKRFEELQQSLGLSLNEVATLVGVCDGSTVARQLGMRPWPANGKTSTTIAYDRAVSYCDALLLDPYQVGI